jgi:predicted dehydrogenase
MDPGFIEAHRLSPFAPRGIDVPVVFDLMIHDIDIALSMVDSEVDSVAASGINVFSPLPDIANARLTFRNGCVANLTASRISIERFRKIRFFQHNTYVSVDYIAPAADVYSKNPTLPDDLDEEEFSKLTPQSLVDHKAMELIQEEPLRLELTDFVESVVSKRTPTVTGQDGLRALDVAMRIMHEMGPDL